MDMVPEHEDINKPKQVDMPLKSVSQSINHSINQLITPPHKKTQTQVRLGLLV